MDSLVAIHKVMSGTEAQRLLDELARWGDAASDIEVDRVDDRTLELTFRGVDYPRARTMVEDVLTAAAPAWSIHVTIPSN